MTMTFFFRDSIQPDGPRDLFDHGVSHSRRSNAGGGEVPLVLGKLQAPAFKGLIARKRLQSILERSRTQFPATLISGRAGTGKTALAATVAQSCARVAWYTVETADIEWRVFSRYFSQALAGAGFGEPAPATPDKDRSPHTVVARFLLRHFFRSEPQQTGQGLIVLDDIHHVFDAEWFDEFFRLLLFSLPAETHLLLLCRSKPPAPLWRLRSKQVLYVIDEDQLAFTPDEAAQLFAKSGRSSSEAKAVNQEYFGRVSKLLEAIHAAPAA